jgi:lysozyme family protein
MTENFIKAIMFTLNAEGIKSSDPLGGSTKYGIARKMHPEITDDQWANFTEDDAIAIYKKQYWTAMGCDTLQYPMDCYVFDCAVNPGPGACHHMLNTCASPLDFNQMRRQYYRNRVTQDPSKSIYLKGWLARVDRLEHTFPDEVTTSEPDLEVTDDNSTI